MMKAKPKESPQPCLPENETFRIEQIKNGVLVHHSSSGKDGSYKHETTYHATKPNFAVAVAPSKIKAPVRAPKPMKKGK